MSSNTIIKYCYRETVDGNPNLNLCVHRFRFQRYTPRVVVVYTTVGEDELMQVRVSWFAVIRSEGKVVQVKHIYNKHCTKDHKFKSSWRKLVHPKSSSLFLVV